MYGHRTTGTYYTNNAAVNLYIIWTTSELSASMPTRGRLKPTRRNGAERRNKGRNISWRNGSLQRKGQSWTTACSGMPERDGKDQGEDRPKQAGSCWFAAMTSFSGVTSVLFCFVFVFMLSLKPRPFVQSSLDNVQAPR